MGLGLGIGEGRREGRWIHGEDVLPRLVGPVAGVLVDGHRGLPQGIEGARHPRLPLPQGLAHQGLHLGLGPFGAGGEGIQQGRVPRRDFQVRGQGENGLCRYPRREVGTVGTAGGQQGQNQHQEQSGTCLHGAPPYGTTG